MRINDHECLVIGGSSVFTSPHLRLREHSRSLDGKNMKCSNGEESYEVLFSGYDIVDVHIKAQQLGLPAHDLFKIKPFKIPAWMGRGF